MVAAAHISSVSNTARLSRVRGPAPTSFRFEASRAARNLVGGVMVALPELSAWRRLTRGPPHFPVMRKVATATVLPLVAALHGILGPRHAGPVPGLLRPFPLVDPPTADRADHLSVELVRVVQSSRRSHVRHHTHRDSRDHLAHGTQPLTCRHVAGKSSTGAINHVARPGHRVCDRQAHRRPKHGRNRARGTPSRRSGGDAPSPR